MSPTLTVMRLAWLYVLLVATGCRGLLGFEEPVPIATDTPDTATVGFATGSSSVDEISGAVRLSVVLSSARSETVSVAYGVGNGTATHGGDFALIVGTLSFAPGELEHSFEVDIIQDTEPEPDETIDLTLSSVSGATLGQATHTITIQSVVTPRATVNLAAVSSNQNEASPATVVAELSMAADVELSIDVALSGTATPGTDYGVSPRVVFPAGTTSVMITVPIVDDMLDEDDEDLVLTLVNPSPGLLLGSTTSHTHLIVDNDLTPTVAFQLQNQSVTESATSRNATVVLSAPSGRTVTVPFSIGGTATSGADFTIATTTPLSFTSGVTSRTVTMNVLQDPTPEPSESVVLTLGAPTNATVGTNATHTLTILNDD